MSLVISKQKAGMEKNDIISVSGGKFRMTTETDISYSAAATK